MMIVGLPAACSQGPAKSLDGLALLDCLEWPVGSSGVVAEGFGDVGGAGDAQDRDGEVAQGSHHLRTVVGAGRGRSLPDRRGWPGPG